jgi:hypothetical protein
MIFNGEIGQYQINENLYMPPQRMASYDGTVRTVSQDNIDFVIFTSFIGFRKNSLIVYTTESGGDVNPAITYGKIIESRELRDGWYSVIVQY